MSSRTNERRDAMPSHLPAARPHSWLGRTFPLVLGLWTFLSSHSRPAAVCAVKLGRLRAGAKRHIPALG